jgi:uncharacterized damage-inducible protein DinB
MNIVENIRSLYSAMEWADAAVWRTVFTSERAAADEVLREKLHHLHKVQHAFLNVWRTRPHTVNAGSSLGMPELAHWSKEFHHDVKTYLSGLNEDRLDDPVELPWAREMTTGIPAAAPTLGETLLQVSLHSAQHRGQVNARLREVGVEPPLIDFIVWLWFHKPAPEWPREALY